MSFHSDQEALCMMTTSQGFPELESAVEQGIGMLALCKTCSADLWLTDNGKASQLHVDCQMKLPVYI